MRDRARGTRARAAQIIAKIRGFRPATPCYRCYFCYRSAFAPADGSKSSNSSSPLRCRNRIVEGHSRSTSSAGLIATARRRPSFSIRARPRSARMASAARRSAPVASSLRASPVVTMRANGKHRTGSGRNNAAPAPLPGRQAATRSVCRRTRGAGLSPKPISRVRLTQRATATGFTARRPRPCDPSSKRTNP